MSRIGTEQPRAVWCCSTCGAIYHKDYPRCPADGAEVVIAERDPLLDARIGHYTIDKLIGEGGMGRVYLAHHAHLPNKRYAIKVLLGDHAASAAMRARFTREAERASQLDHPNVVKVVDFGQTGHGLLYIVMDHVDGVSLVSLIGQQPMAPARVIALTRGICQGLVYAHAAGIVHRDLKPENILVSSGPTGQVPHIVDFGLALSVDQSDARLTESGMTMGTPAFAAPEQLAGKPVDHRADLYALGMVMFEMLTGGMAPFDGHILEVMSARAARDVPRVTERAPQLEIPPGLEDIVARLTRRRPFERFAGAGEVIEALDRLQGAPQAGPQIGAPTERIARRSARRRWLAAAAAAAFVGGGLAWYAAEASFRAAPRASVEGEASADSPAPVAGPGAAPVVAPGAAAAPVAAVVPAVVAAPPASAVALAGAAPGAPVEPVARAAPPVPPAHAPARRHRPRPGHPAIRTEPAVAPTPVAEPPRAAPAPVAPQIDLATPAPVAAVPAPPPPPPRELRATIDHVDVSGSLPAGAVQRAVERRSSAIARCMPAAPQTVIAHFTIGETRRAQDVRASGATPETNACISAALGDVRTEEAPDVGDVEVTLRIAFVVKT